LALTIRPTASSQVGGVELSQIAFAERNARVGVVFFVFELFQAATNRFVVVAQRARGSRLAARSAAGVATIWPATFGAESFRRAAATAATTTASARTAIFAFLPRRTFAELGLRAVGGEACVSRFQTLGRLAEFIAAERFFAARSVGPEISILRGSARSLGRPARTIAATSIPSATAASSSLATSPLALGAARTGRRQLIRFAHEIARSALADFLILRSAGFVEPVSFIEALGIAAGGTVEIARCESIAPLARRLVATSATATAATSATTRAIRIVVAAVAARRARLVTAQAARVDVARVDISRIDFIVDTEVANRLGAWQGGSGIDITRIDVARVNITRIDVARGDVAIARRATRRTTIIAATASSAALAVAIAIALRATAARSAAVAVSFAAAIYATTIAAPASIASTTFTAATFTAATFTAATFTAASVAIAPLRPATFGPASFRTIAFRTTTFAAPLARMLATRRFADRGVARCGRAIVVAARRLGIASSLRRHRRRLARVGGRLGFRTKRRVLSEGRFARRTRLEAGRRRNFRGRRRRRGGCCCGGFRGASLLRGSADAEPTRQIVPTAATRLLERRGRRHGGHRRSRGRRFGLRSRTRGGRFVVGAEFLGERVPTAQLLFLIGHAYPFRQKLRNAGAQGTTFPRPSVLSVLEALIIGGASIAVKS
jgi:hypothetical protein